jgi:hypothetical protein
MRVVPIHQQTRDHFNGVGKLVRLLLLAGEQILPHPAYSIDLHFASAEVRPSGLEKPSPRATQAIALFVFYIVCEVAEGRNLCPNEVGMKSSSILQKVQLWRRRKRKLGITFRPLA